MQSPYPDKAPEGYKKYGWTTVAHVIMGGAQECHCVDVHPEETQVDACSFIIVPVDTGIARALTCDDIASPTAKCRVYFTTCPICPKVCRQEWVFDNLKLNGNLINFPEGCEKRAVRNFVKAAGNIDILYPQMVG